MPYSYEEKLKSLLDDPSIHNWVKPIAKMLQDHDPVDALNDCELLVRMCEARLGNRFASNRL